LLYWQNRAPLNQPNRRGTDPYARWCDRESPRGPTYVDFTLLSQLNLRQPVRKNHLRWLRSGYDEKLEVDPTNLRFLFQGVTKKEKDWKNYGEIPWRLGILEAVKTPVRTQVEAIAGRWSIEKARQ